jgi:hypothetical protein
LLKSLGGEHVRQALSFCLRDLIRIKDVPAHTRTANLLKLHNSSLIRSQDISPPSSMGHPLQLSQPFSKVRRLQCLDIGFYQLANSLASAGVRSPTATASKSDRYGGVTVSGKLAGLCNYPNDSLHATVSV